jgi:Holliday junction DNA helicase RuvA
MYDHLCGELTDRHATRAVVRVAGVGYELKVPTGSLRDARIGDAVVLHTILDVVDGMPQLLGFASRPEREIARRLLTVNGVGPSMTIAILSTYTPTEIAGAILRGDHAALRRIKGVGTKTAERLCIELRDQIHKLDLGTVPTEPLVALLPRSQEDAIAALVTLGYSEKEARERVRKVVGEQPDVETEALVKIVLRG